MKHQEQLVALIDSYQARHADSPPPQTASADRAVGRIQREHNLGVQDCLRLLAFGVGYVSARYSTQETPSFDLDEHLGDEHIQLLAAGVVAGRAAAVVYDANRDNPQVVP